MSCPMCEGRGFIYFETPTYMTVTREMAIDAGDRSLEGTEIQWGTEEVEVPCENCEGKGQLTDEEKKYE